MADVAMEVRKLDEQPKLTPGDVAQDDNIGQDDDGPSKQNQSAEDSGILSWFSSIIEPAKHEFPKAEEPEGGKESEESTTATNDQKPQLLEPSKSEPETDLSTHEDDILSANDSETGQPGPESPPTPVFEHVSGFEPSLESSDQNKTPTDTDGDSKIKPSPTTTDEPPTPPLFPVEAIRKARPSARFRQKHKHKHKKTRKDRKRRPSAATSLTHDEQPPTFDDFESDRLVADDQSQSSTSTRKKSTDSSSTTASQPNKDDESFFNSLFHRKKEESSSPSIEENSEILLKAEWNQAEVTNEMFHEQINAVKSEKENLDRRLTKALRIIEELNDKVIVQEKIISKQEKQVISLNEENDELKTKTQNLEETRSTLTASLKQMEEGYELDRNEYNETIAELEQKYYESRQERDKLSAAERNYQKVIDDLQHHLEHLEKGLEQAEKQARELSKNGNSLYIPSSPLIEAEEDDDERLLLHFQGLTFIPRDIAQMKGSTVTVLDLSGNQIRSGVNLELFSCLKTLILDRNGIERLVDYPNVPSLDTLWLNNNKIRDLPALLDTVRDLFPNLTYLSLLQNPCCPFLQKGGSDEEEHKYDDYRLWILRKIPKLQILDTRPINNQERRDTMF